MGRPNHRSRFPRWAFGSRRLPRTAGLFLGAALALSPFLLGGCGDLPLFPGELALSPDTLTLEEGTEVTLTRTGGFEPIAWTLEPPSPGGGSFDSESLGYTAPTGLLGESLAVVLTATDSAEQSDILEITVFKTFSIDPVSATVEVDGTIQFSLSGGVRPYTYTPSSGSVEETDAGPPTLITYTAPGTVRSEVSVMATDSLGNVAEAQVTVVSPGTLTVNPTSVVLAVKGSQTFVVTGGTPDYSYSLTGSGSLSNEVLTDPGSFDYTAPASATADTVEVTDSTPSSVTVHIYVGSLSLSPSKVATQAGQTTVFSAAGGVPAYSWRVDGAGSIAAQDSNHAVYTAVAPGTDWVTVTDSQGQKRKTKVDID